MPVFDAMQSDEFSILEMDNTDSLLAIRAEALDVAEDIARQIEADKTLPRPDAKWRSRAVAAQRWAMRRARAASARILELKPELLAWEATPEDAAESAIVVQLREDGKRKSERIRQLLEISVTRNRQIRSQRARIERQAAQLTQQSQLLTEGKASREAERQAAHEARMKMEKDRVKCFDGAFFMAAKAMLTGEQFAAICDRARLTSDTEMSEVSQ